MNIFKRIANLETKVAELQAENNELKRMVNQDNIEALKSFNNYINQFIENGFRSEISFPHFYDYTDAYEKGVDTFFHLVRYVMKQKDINEKEINEKEIKAINSEQFLDKIVKRIKDKQVN